MDGAMDRPNSAKSVVEVASCMPRASVTKSALLASYNGGVEGLEQL